jgi:hypothetical protein
MKLLSLLLLITLISCKKDVGFDMIELSQGGESVLVKGLLKSPLAYDFSYSITAIECGVPVDRLVVIKSGETYGELHYQSNCKINEWHIRRAGELIQ